jgi:hypothetical protein
MNTEYQCRWVSRSRASAIKKSRSPNPALLLDTFNGMLIVEPVGSDLGDGAILAPQEADYELQPVWFLGPKTKLQEARRRLGLSAETSEDLLAAVEV